MNWFRAPWRFLRDQPAFRRLWLGTAASELGSAVSRIAFILLVHERAVSRSAAPETANAWMLVLETLPIILLGPIAGALVDRVDRRRLLVGCNVAQAVLTALVPLAARLDSVWPLYALAMLVAAVSTVYPPARQSAIPDLVGVERSGTANGASSSTTSFMFVAGAGLAGFLIGQFGKDACFLLTASSSVFAAIWLRGLDLPVRSPATEGRTSFGSEVRAGLSYVWSQPMILYILVCYVVAFLFIGIWLPLVPEYLRRDLGVDADTWMPRSWLAFGLGGILGGALGPSLGRFVGRGRFVVLVYFVEPFQMMAYYFVGSAALMVVLSFTWGVLAFAYFVQEQTVMHEDVPREVRGRVFGLLPPLQALGTLLASGIVLAEAGAVAPRTMLLLAGASYLVLSSAFMLGMPGGRALWRRRDPPESIPDPG